MVFLASTGTAVLWVALGTCVACIVHLFPDSTLGFLARKFQAKNILLGACRGQRKLRWEVWGGLELARRVGPPGPATEDTARPCLPVDCSYSRQSGNACFFQFPGTVTERRLRCPGLMWAHAVGVTGSLRHKPVMSREQRCLPPPGGGCCHGFPSLSQSSLSHCPHCRVAGLLLACQSLGNPGIGVP